MNRTNIIESLSEVKLFLFLFSASFVFSVQVGLAQDVEVKNPILKSDVVEIIEDTIFWLLGVAGLLAFLILIISGIMYVVSSGDEQKATTAKKAFNYTLVGLILILISYSIIIVLSNIFI